METFSALLAICAGNSPVPGEFPAQRPVTQSFDVFFDLRPNKLLSKQWWGWWFETTSSPLWRHCNDLFVAHSTLMANRQTHQMICKAHHKINSNELLRCHLCGEAACSFSAQGISNMDGISLVRFHYHTCTILFLNDRIVVMLNSTSWRHSFAY